MTTFQDKEETRREFLQILATATGAVVLMPLVTSCSGPDQVEDDVPVADPVVPVAPPVEPTPPPPPKMAEVPMVKPEDWDPIAFNKERGNAGAIPESYLESINGPDGDTEHLGKHLPYIPMATKLTRVKAPTGFIAIMWGDPSKGYAQHPNAPKSEETPDGHWYNWITIRKAVAEDAEELKSEYPDWPGDKAAIGKKYSVQGGGRDVEVDGGKKTIYLAALPKGLVKGDLVRVYAHCLTHGEYVDFLTIP